MTQPVDTLWTRVISKQPGRYIGCPTITLDIADDFGAHKPTLVQLRLRVNEWTNRDAVQVWWDKEELEAPQIDYCRLDASSPPGGAFLPLPRWRDIAEVSSAVWLSWDFSEAKISAGAHTVRIAVQERNPQVKVALILTDVELVVRY